MSNIAGVEFVGNNLRGRNFCWVKCAKTLTSVVNTNLKVGRSKEFKVIQKIFTASSKTWPLTFVKIAESLLPLTTSLISIENIM